MNVNKIEKGTEGMSVSLISKNLLNQFQELLEKTEGELNIISPFIGTQTANMLTEWLVKNPSIECNIITRFYREDFIERVSSIYGLERLLHANANIYALVDLHSKLYLFDSHSTIIGSANFTKGGFISNHELCVLIDEEHEIAEQAHEYFFDLFDQVKSFENVSKVTQGWIDEEKKHVPQLGAERKNKTVVYSNNKKRGAELKKIVQPDLFEKILENKVEDNDADGIWLKFEGTGEDRIPNDINYQQMKGIRKRDLKTTYFPRQPSGILKDDILFLTIVSYDEHGKATPMIVGYTKTSGFNKNNVVADEEIKDTPWKHRFPYYVEFTEGRVINAPIKNGIRLVDLYNSVGKAAFPSLRKRSNVSQSTLQSMHFRRSHIRITQEAHDFLIAELKKRFSRYGETKL